jgi:nitrite reductase (NADH) large subunit
LASKAGLFVNRGIIVDNAMRASAAKFYAIGECAEHKGVAYGLVEPAYAQAEALASTLAGDEKPFNGMVLSTNLKVSGIAVFSAGDFMGSEGTDSVVLENRHAGVYRKLVFAGPHLVGCVCVGEAEDGLWYLDLIRQGTDISASRASLIHGRDFTTSAGSPADLTAEAA